MHAREKIVTSSLLAGLLDWRWFSGQAILPGFF